MLRTSAINSRGLTPLSLEFDRIRGLSFWLVLTLGFSCTNWVNSQEKDLPAPRPQSQGSTDARVDWLNGKELRKSSLLAISGDFHGSLLRPRLVQLASQQRTGIFVDRRVDPSIELNHAFVDQTLEQFLWTLADEHELGVCRVGDVFYFGPQRTANSLPILLFRMKLETNEFRRSREKSVWHLQSELSWPELTEPRELIVELLAANGIELTNPELIPFDLWPATQLPKLSLDHRIALLLVGFDLWFARSPNSQADKLVTLAPYPNIAKGTCSVTNVQDAGKAARTLRTEIENGKFSGKGKTLKMTGTSEALLQARRWLVNRQQPKRGLIADHRFSIDTTAQRGTILATVAGRINCKLSYPASAKNELLERVSIKMVQQPVEAIIAEVLKGTQLAYEIRSSQLIIK